MANFASPSADLSTPHLATPYSPGPPPPSVPMHDVSFVCLGISGDVVCKNLFVAGDLLVFTDGSFDGDKLGFAFCIFSDRDCLFPLFEFQGVLTSRKTILDAEATALLSGLDTAISQPHTGTIYLISDCRAALTMFQTEPRPGPLGYLYEPLHRLTAASTRPIVTSWIKGHSNHPSNDRADLLTRTAIILQDIFPGTSHSYLSLHLTTATSTEWLSWFHKVPHHYTHPPRKGLRHHRRHSRLESSVLFRLRSNKRWSPGDNVGTSTPPPCPCNGSTPRDGTHLTVCPTTSRLRPPDIAAWINQDHRSPSVLRWASCHRYFGIQLHTSEVRWITLARPGNISRSSVRTCSICTRTFTNQSHLTRHMAHIHPDCSSTNFIIGRPHPCTSCTLVYHTKTELDTHTASIHGCPDCAKLFSEIANMFRHQISCHGGILCTGCSRRYSSRMNLRIHQRSNCGGSRS